MTRPLNHYNTLKNQYTEDFNKLSSKHKIISTIRLCLAFLFVFTLYQSINTKEITYIATCIFTIIFFVVLMKIHARIAKQKNFKNQLIKINQDEINYLQNNDLLFPDGSQYINTKHLYAFDLDFFGKNSLFQHLNRTSTYIGDYKLAQFLLNLKNIKDIELNQKAIKELVNKIEWRQNLSALAKSCKDNEENYKNLIEWAAVKPSNFSRIKFLITPTLFILAVLVYLFTNEFMYMRVGIALFIINLGITATQLKKINHEIEGVSKIHEIINQYSLIIEQVEQESFESEKLNQYKNSLLGQSISASKNIKKLSSLFYNLDNVHNLLGSLLFNGTVLYHIHALHQLINWKKEYAHQIQLWLEIIGNIEALNSLANFSYNNPNFIFPNLNQEFNIEFQGLGHPLIDANKRVNNSITFQKDNFIILTGSNMSGKSTFLRTLGINMVLTGIGAPICAEKANIHPLRVIVSMKQTDSLSDGESYFFAEVKRLKHIMQEISSETCFVLLDEILRGTNSDDKRTGTIEVIKKILSKNAIGCIATHDLEVCQTTQDFPNQLNNKCFEVEIINNDLYFDYKLKDGICKNKNATFLMKKLEII